MPHVLIVEDNRALAGMAEAMIRAECGFEVSIAATMGEALALIDGAAEPFLVAVLDLNLPDACDGEIVDEVTKRGVPAVVLTGSFGDEMRNQMMQRGVLDYVLKSNVAAYEYVARLVKRVSRNRGTEVLVVDDSGTARAVLKHQLSMQLLTVHTAADGEQALKVLQANPKIRLVFTDYNMPGMDGFELTQKIRANHGKDRLAIVGLSGQDDGRLSSHFLKSGANDFLGKPFSYEELLCRVTQNLEILEQIEEIRDAANRDYLTKLYNRRYFFDAGGRRYQQAKSAGGPLSAAMMDIDFFKKVNDNHGHDGGDVALRHMAELLTTAFPDDLVARFGGEEFCVVIEAPPEEAFARLDTFRQRVEDTPVDRDGYHFPFTVSVGVTDTLGENLDAMLNIADANLYRAKEGGRNRVVAGEGSGEANPDGTTRQR